MNEELIRARLADSLEYIAKRVRENTGRPLDWMVTLQNIIFWLAKMERTAVERDRAAQVDKMLDEVLAPRRRRSFWTGW